MQIYNSFSECRNHSALHGRWDTHLSALGLQTQQEDPKRMHVYLWGSQHGVGVRQCEESEATYVYATA
jgi:hypothetical protein